MVAHADRPAFVMKLDTLERLSMVLLLMSMFVLLQQLERATKRVGYSLGIQPTTILLLFKAVTRCLEINGRITSVTCPRPGQRHTGKFCWSMAQIVESCRWTKG